MTGSQLGWCIHPSCKRCVSLFFIHLIFHIAPCAHQMSARCPDGTQPPPLCVAQGTGWAYPPTTHHDPSARTKHESDASLLTQDHPQPVRSQKNPSGTCCHPPTTTHNYVLRSRRGLPHPTTILHHPQNVNGS